MGKRSSFKRRKRDFYPTPYEGVTPLLPHLPEGTMFVEPCAGDGALVDHLEMNGHHCIGAYDIQPRCEGVRMLDALTADYLAPPCIITNPPWDRDILHPLIIRLSRQAPTWLLFDADWMHTRQSWRFLPMLRKVVSVGRLKWIPGSKHTGKDNCCWYLFDANSNGPIEFFGRSA